MFIVDIAQTSKLRLMKIQYIEIAKKKKKTQVNQYEYSDLRNVCEMVNFGIIGTSVKHKQI